MGVRPEKDSCRALRACGATTGPTWPDFRVGSGAVGRALQVSPALALSPTDFSSTERDYARRLAGCPARDWDPGDNRAAAEANTAVWANPGPAPPGYTGGGCLDPTAVGTASVEQVTSGPWTDRSTVEPQGLDGLSLVTPSDRLCLFVFPSRADRLRERGGNALTSIRRNEQADARHLRKQTSRKSAPDEIVTDRLRKQSRTHRGRCMEARVARSMVRARALAKHLPLLLLAALCPSPAADFAMTTREGSRVATAVGPDWHTTSEPCIPNLL